MRWSWAVLALASATFAASPASAQLMRYDGWWVVLTSIRDDGSMKPHQQMESFRHRMRGCGVEIFNDYSSKFIGFAPGYLVAVSGAYRTEVEARAQLPKLRGCAPEAYVKRARHAGE